MRDSETDIKLNPSDDLLEAYLWVASTLKLGKRRPKKKNTSDR